MAKQTRKRNSQPKRNAKPKARSRAKAPARVKLVSKIEPGMRPTANVVAARGSTFAVVDVATLSRKRKLNVFPDLPDIRDREYAPTLAILQPVQHPPMGVPVRDQGEEGACTGFGLATVVDVLNATRARLYPGLPSQVSSRMIYEMAKLHDEWRGIKYEGSSVRGAVKGFYHNGVCSELSAPYRPGTTNWALTIEAAKEARNQRLGAYYRLRRSITDFHAALNETGAIFASARIRRGWDEAHGKEEIPAAGAVLGGHAFAIVGYDDRGFFVQNSWGPSWGRNGIARWTYADWAETLVDAWVLQLSVPTPSAFILPQSSLTGGRSVVGRAGDVRRGEINGHFINIDDGVLQETGKYATPLSSVIETAKRIEEETAATPGERKYDHLMVYAHGGLNSLDDEAARIEHLKPGFKRNGIYNFHLMWGTSAFDLLWDGLVGAAAKRDERIGSILTDLWDEAFELALGGTGKVAWSRAKTDAESSFAPGGGGTKGLTPILDAGASGNRPLAIHLIGHSAGTILAGRMLQRLAAAAKKPITFASAHLMAPACSTEFFNELYAPFIGAKSGKVRIDKLYIYNLDQPRELKDTVGGALGKLPLDVYFKSLLYLVSNAFETKPELPLAGMDLFRGMLKGSPKIALAGVDRDITDSASHGGFDNDVVTMNTILTRILGKPSAQPFKPEELIGF